MFFGSNKTNNRIDELLNKLLLLKKKDPSCEVFEESRLIYEELSKIMFEALENNDIDTAVKILSGKYISAKSLVDENGYNILIHFLFNKKDDMFKLFYNNYYDLICSCIDRIPDMFTIVLKKRNYDMIEFLLKDAGWDESLNKSNVNELFFMCIQDEKDELTNYLIRHYEHKIDARNFEANLLYCISHSQTDNLKKLLSYEPLVEKIGRQNIENIVALCLLRKEDKPLELFMDNTHFTRVIENSAPSTKKNILMIAYDKDNQNLGRAMYNNRKIKEDIITSKD